jgi:hypothetical protein
MKEQLMQKRYDRFIKIAETIKEEVTKKNSDLKQKAEIESVQRFQQYQKDASTTELTMLDKIVKQSGLHMEEVLRRQRRKKKFFYDKMNDKFGGYWNNKLETISKPRFVLDEGVPGASQKKSSGGIKLFALRQKGVDINVVLK